VSSISDDSQVLLHQGIGLEAFNRLPHRKAVHALYECCNSLEMADDLALGRPYPRHSALFREADALLFALPDESVDEILQAHPRVASRPRSVRSHAEQCALWDDRPGVMMLLESSARRYEETFGFQFIMYVRPEASVSPVIAAITDRLHHDSQTERKVILNEVARINRSRLERMLGPEGGYDNWA